MNEIAFWLKKLSTLSFSAGRFLIPVVFLVQSNCSNFLSMKRGQVLQIAQYQFEKNGGQT